MVTMYYLDDAPHVRVKGRIEPGDLPGTLRMLGEIVKEGRAVVEYE